MNERPRPLIIIVGPTAVGKSSLALELAQNWKTDLVSLDAFQVYRYLDIGTAKPTPEERSRVPHHMIDIINPDEQYNAGRYAKEAGQKIAQIHQSGQIPLVVGGCGLYLKALLHGLCSGPPIDMVLRKKLQEEALTMGREHLYHRLQELDPQAAKRLHPHDSSRIIRAIEIYLQTGTTISSLQKAHSFTETYYQSKIFGLTCRRSDLYTRIEKRVEDMIEKGLVEEIKQLFERGYNQDAPGLLGLGYHQIINALEGKYSLEEAIRIIKRDTRHYAKRQFTWFQQTETVRWIDLTPPFSFSAVIKKIQEESAALFS